MTIHSSTRLGDFEILALIGVGGMGEVYRALDTKLGRQVAIKVLPEAVSRDSERLSRFAREAKLLASLNHPNVATLYGLEERDGRQLLIMELVEGETLADRIARGRLAIGEVLALFAQVADGLDAAHQKGVVHRDLKPANINVTRDGKVKILDFGLAKAFGAGFAADVQSDSPTVTREGTESGVILGTAAYMSPEQARGKTVDKRTDVWAFGCCLFEALTGRRPFRGETVSDTIAKILEKEPDWSAFSPEVSPFLVALVRRCLEKSASRRLRDFSDLRIWLDEAAAGTSEPVPHGLSPGPFASRWSALALAAVSIFLAANILISLGQRVETRNEVVRSILPIGTSLGNGDEIRPLTTISPDGRTIVYAARNAELEDTQLYSRALDDLTAQPILGTKGGQLPFFSPDGKWIGFWRVREQGGALEKVSIGGGAPVLLAHVGGARGASWGSDGNIVFDRNGTGLSRVSSNGGTVEVLTTADANRGEETHRFPEVLPGARAVLFTLGRGNVNSYDAAAIAVLSLETGEHRVLLEGGMNPRYSETGHIVYGHAGALLAVPFDLDRLRVTGPPTRVVEGVVTDAAWARAEFALSRAGTLVYAAGEPLESLSRVFWVDREGRRELLIDGQPLDGPALSPDGRYLALHIRRGNVSIGLYDLSRGALTEFESGFDNMVPVWTPDGRRLAFRSNREGVEAMYWRDVDGRGETTRLLASPYPQQAGSWSPDGKTLVFDEGRSPTKRALMTVELDGNGTPGVLLDTGSRNRNPRFSPDGQWIAYESNASGRFEIYVRRFPDGEVHQVSTEGSSSFRWNPNGRELFYWSGEKMIAVDFREGAELSLGTPRVLFEHPYFGAFDVSRDGQRFIMVEGVPRAAPTEIVLVQNFAEELKRLAPTEN